MIIEVFMRKLNNKIYLIPINNIEADYEVRIIFNKGSNIECGIERGYVHFFEHVIILEDMMRCLSDSVYFAEGYTDLDHMQIKFLCQSSKQLIHLLTYINKITELIDIPDDVIRQTQDIVMREIDVKNVQNIDSKSKILFLSEGKVDLPIGKRENIVDINKTKLLEFINRYLNCVEICLVIFSDLNNIKIIDYCKNIFLKKM